MKKFILQFYDVLKPTTQILVTVPEAALCRRFFFQRNLYAIQKKSFSSHITTSKSLVDDIDSSKSSLVPASTSKKLPILQYPKEPDNEIEALPSEQGKRKFMELMQNLKLCEDIPSLTYFYWNNKDEFEKPQYLCLMQKFAEIQTGRLSDPDLLKNKEFQSICYRIWKLLSSFEATEVLQLYKNFLEIGVPTEFLIMQSLLQMMRHHINIFDVKDLLFMKRLLVKTTSCKLKNALEKAIPRVLENHVNFYVSPKLQIHELLQMLDMCIKGKVEGVEKILFLIYHKKLQDLYYPQTPYYENNLVSLVWNLLDIYMLEDKPKIIKPSKDIDIVVNVLLNNTLEELIKTRALHSLKVEQILALTKKLQMVYSKGHDIALNMKFMKCVSGLAKHWDFVSMSKIIAYQVVMHYVSKNLLYSATSQLLSKEKGSDLSSVKFFPLLSAVAATDNVKLSYTQEIISDLMKQPQNPQPKVNIDVPWIKLALNIISLKYLPEELLKTVLEEHYLRRYLEFRSNSKIEYLDLLRLHRALKLFWPKASVEVPENILQTAIKIQREDIPTPYLTDTLKVIVGENYIASNIFTPTLTLIDHLILLDERRTAIPLSCEAVTNVPKELSSINISKNVQPKYGVALMEIPATWTCQPDLSLRGYFKVEMEIIQKELTDQFLCSTNLVPLFEQEISNMDEIEIPRYLKEKLNIINL